MKLPAYRDRKPSVFRAALKWAQTQLCLRDWDIDLYLDDEVTEDRFDELVGHPGGALLYFSNMRAYIGVQRDLCRDEDCDPLAVLFHEIAHVAMAFGQMVDTKLAYEECWDQAANRFAPLLLQLWEHQSCANNASCCKK